MSSNKQSEQKGTMFAENQAENARRDIKDTKEAREQQLPRTEKDKTLGDKNQDKQQ